MRKGKFLSQVKNRRDHAAKLLSKLKLPLLFGFSQVVNSQNNYRLALPPQDLPIVMKTKRRIHMMVFGVVARDGDAIPPFIFPHDPRLNREAYIRCLEEIVLTWIKCLVKGFCAVPHKQKSQVLAVRKLLQPHHS